MIHLNNFNNYKTNEALGIADATLFYIDLIKGRCVVEILDFISSNPKLDDEEKDDIVFRYTDLRKFVTNWVVYQDFPVSEITIDLSMIKKKPGSLKSRNKVTRKEEISSFLIGGYASPFAKGREKAAARIKDPIKMNMDHTVSIHLGIEFEFSSNLNLDKDERKIETKVESTILHELNHAFEFYKRKIMGRSEIEYTTTWTSIGPNRMRRPKVIFDYWQSHFTDYIYMSEPHEVRAYVQEAKAYVDKMGFDSFKKTNIWKVAKIMETFSIKEFIKDFDEIVHDYNPEYVGKITSTLIRDFKKEYSRLSKEYKEENAIKPEFLDKLGDEEFLAFWENRIKKAGTTIVRKMIRLYTYKKDREEELY